MNAHHFIGSREKERISQAIAAAEQKSNGEIITMVVSQSDAYPGATWRLGVFFGLSASFLYYLMIPEFTAWFYMGFMIPLIFIGKFLGHIPMFLRLALSDDEVEEEVYQRALQEFHHHKLSRTEQRTAVLIYVSLLERRVIVLADEGINAKVDTYVWNGIVQSLLEDIRKKQVVDGFIKAVNVCGDILSQHFPPGVRNPNELPNKLIIKN